jgi:hypothetical protein
VAEEKRMRTLARTFAVLTALGLGLGASAYAPDAAARTQISVGINVAPPAPRYEVVPPPRVGYAWAPGYWRWDPYARRHVWVVGRWMPARHGYVYRQPRWEHYRGGWRFHDGYWGH